MYISEVWLYVIHCLPSRLFQLMPSSVLFQSPNAVKIISGLRASACIRHGLLPTREKTLMWMWRATSIRFRFHNTSWAVGLPTRRSAGRVDANVEAPSWVAQHRGDGLRCQRSRKSSANVGVRQPPITNGLQCKSRSHQNNWRARTFVRINGGG